MIELEAEKKKITSYFVEFACYLREKAVLHYNDAFGEYVDKMLLEEKASFGRRTG